MQTPRNTTRRLLVAGKLHTQLESMPAGVPRSGSVPSEKPGGAAMGLETLAGGLAAEGFDSVVGMMAVVDENTDRPVDGGQLRQPGHSGNQRFGGTSTSRVIR